MEDNSKSESRQKRGTSRSTANVGPAAGANELTSFGGIDTNVGGAASAAGASRPQPISRPAEGDSGGFRDRLKNTATSQLEKQKARATDGLGNVAQAVRQSTQPLRDRQQDTIARYIEQGADQLQRFSERLKTKDVNELLSDLQRIVRRQPALFVGGAFALGLIGARFLKSAPPDRLQRYQGEYGSSAIGTSGRMENY